MESVYGTVTVKADLQAFLRAADQVSGLTNRLKSIFDEMQSLIDNTKVFWNGDAAEKYRKGFSEQKDEMGKIIQTLEKYPDDLRRISGNYESTINRNIETANVLNTDFVMV